MSEWVDIFSGQDTPNESFADFLAGKRNGQNQGPAAENRAGIGREDIRISPVRVATSRIKSDQLTNYFGEGHQRGSL